jgi:hypothetical protein
VAEVSAEVSVEVRVEGRLWLEARVFCANGPLVV